jgi:nucleoid DNA-binding protein
VAGRGAAAAAVARPPPPGPSPAWARAPRAPAAARRPHPLAHRRLRLNPQDTSKAVDALLNAIVHGVASGKEVVIPGFGSFKPRHRKARTGRNPKTGAELKIEAKVSPAFT